LYAEKPFGEHTKFLIIIIMLCHQQSCVIYIWNYQINVSENRFGILNRTNHFSKLYNYNNGKFVWDNCERNETVYHVHFQQINSHAMEYMPNQRGIIFGHNAYNF
jgi:hypothetical protein